MLGCIFYDLVVDDMGIAWSNSKEVCGWLKTLVKQSSAVLGMERPPINTLTPTMIKGAGAPKMKLKWRPKWSPIKLKLSS